jgi:copper chaperone CopZ
MAKVTISVPKMFADHHVLKVKDALSALDGVGGVVASSAWRAVIVAYDEAKANASDIEAALTKAGYEPGAEAPMLAANIDNYRDPAWEAVGTRTTTTNQADLTMSGEFRKY